MMIGRWQRAKEWITLHSKSKPAQIGLSLIAGGSIASTLYQGGELIMSLTTPGSAVFIGFKVVEILIVITAFGAATTLASNNIAASIAGADKRDEHIAEHSKTFKKIKPRLNQLTETAHYLVEKDKIHSASGNHNTHILQLLVKATELLARDNPNPEAQTMCQEAARLAPSFLNAEPLDLAIQYEPYFTEPNSPLEVGDIELGMVRGPETHRGDYGTFFPPAFENTMLERIDLENVFSDVPLEQYASL